ncbi:MAG: polyphosphate:AMP phosphotransferase [Gammaproteobacteria bacterium]
MFEIAELGNKIKKSEYKKKVPELRTKLLTVQQNHRDCDSPVIILISGVDGGGKGDVVNQLNEWMDPRYIRTQAFDMPTDEERERPKFWRYWRSLPPKGIIAIFVGSWYSDPISFSVLGEMDKESLMIELMRIKQFEQELIDDGALIIKCWLHLSKGEQKKRMKAWEKNPETRWKVTERDKKHLEIYDEFLAVAETVLMETSTGNAPWLIVDGSDLRYSSLTVGDHVHDRIARHIEQRKSRTAAAPVVESVDEIRIGQNSLLDSLDLSLEMDDKDYERQLTFYQEKLGWLTRIAKQQKQSCIVVLEGWDAAGKGGAIRRLTRAMDARNYQVIPIGAPTDEELQHHYLWRFWRHIPRAGNVTLYDRSWYGRVLVERVEGLATEEEWMRGYEEIVNFEESLTDHGILLLKFWLHIDKDEQLRRFKAREKISYKKYKITEDDYRNREKWSDYMLAVDEMVARTSSKNASWCLVEGNDKHYARVKIIRTFCEKLEPLLEH